MTRGGSAAGTPGPQPLIDHLFLIVMENHGLNNSPTIDSTNGIWHSTTSCPYINNTLIAGGFLCTNYSDDTATVNSLGNYIQMIAGTDFGITDDANPPTNLQAASTRTLVDLLEAKGLSWKCYAEAYPGGAGTNPITDGDAGTSILGGANPLYVEHHIPFAYFHSVRDFASRSLKIQDFTNFTATADLSTTSFQGTPSFSFIVPNMNNDMHDGTAATADSWLSTNVALIQGSYAWAQRRCLIVVIWDETNHATSEIIPCIFFSNTVNWLGAKVNVTGATAHTHPGLLATIQYLFKLPNLGQLDASAAAITEAFN